MAPSSFNSFGSLGKLGSVVETVSADPYALLESLGDKPEWLKVKSYREGYDPRRKRRISEVMLTLRGKDYWFPTSPKIYESFVSRASSGTRGSALKYLQKYIRRYRDYQERWPDQDYTDKNKVPGKSHFTDLVEQYFRTQKS
jgi:hypothetical protein